MMKLYRYYLSVIFIILQAKPSYANAGIPMLALALPGMIVSLVPVILIESLSIRKSLNISFARSVKIMSIANIESTLIGIPLTWIVWVIVEMIFRYIGYIGYQLTKSLGIEVPDFVGFVFALTIGAAWLGPIDSKQALWMLPVASLVLLVPFFYVSWLFERHRVKRLLQECAPENVNSATLKANIYSYALLGLVVIGWLIVSLTKKGNS